MTNREIVFAAARDVDVVVPATPATLTAIMAAYPLTWVRAGNAPYFGGVGHLVGLAAERGTVYPDLGNQAVTSRWPALYIEDGKASFGPTDAVRARAAACALSAGPMLVENGQIVDISAAIRVGGYDAYDPTRRKAQRAVGITRDGLMADGTWLAATLYEVAQDMLAAGCTEVMKLDGGGSAGIVVSDGGTPRLVMGAAARLLPAALVMRRVERAWDGQIGGVTMADKPKVYLSPSNQRLNSGVGNYGTEQSRMRPLAWRVGALLAAAGADVAISRSDEEIPAVVAASNAYRPIYHICLHSNAGGGKGVEGFHWPGSTKGQALTKALVEALAIINPGGYRRVEPNTIYAEISGPDAVCSYIEVGFHDRAEEADWIVTETERIGSIIAQCICHQLDLPAPTISVSDDAISQLVIAKGKLAEIRQIVNS